MSKDDSTIFIDHLARWGLSPDGHPIVTPTSRLLPVRYQGEPAMLKLAEADEERWGAGLLAWWGGDGAVRVLEHDGDAILMERATGPRSLAAMAQQDEAGDDEAGRILCAVAGRLHATGGRPAPPALTPLDRWFAALGPGAVAHGDRSPILHRAATTAGALLADPRDVVPLHGDLHHGNVLDAGPHGWLAIDPKRLGGERGFDYANLFRNPDDEVATRPGRLARQADIVAEAAGLDRDRLLRWILALCGLSAAWHLADGGEPAADLAVAELALAELERGRRGGGRLAWAPLPNVGERSGARARAQRWSSRTGCQVDAGRAGAGRRRRPGRCRRRRSRG